MKKCPKCGSDYFDETLEFCLEDGSRLTTAAAIASSKFTGEIPTVIRNRDAEIPALKTEILPNFNAKANLVEKNTFSGAREITAGAAQTAANGGAAANGKIENFKDKITYQGNKIIETAPIVFALAHNYWQWLYLNKPNNSETYEYFTSAAFLTWLFLLFFGTGVGFLSLKFGKNKVFAVTSLVILAINLLLFIVPRK